MFFNIFNILFNMGIYANVERFDLNNYREYDSIEDAMDNGKFRLDLYSAEDKEKLKDYLSRILQKTPKQENFTTLKIKRTGLWFGGEKNEAVCS